MKKRRFIVLCSFMLCVFIVCIIYIILKNNQATEANYNHKYYSITIPKNFSVKEVDDYDTRLYLDEKYVGSMSVNPECRYCTSIDSIVTNWYGMKAYVKGTPVEEQVDEYKLVKLTIAYEQSAAEVENGDSPSSDEVHYLYTDYENYILDLSFNSSYVSEDELNSIVRSVNIK